MNITPEHVALLKIAEQKHSTDNLVTRVLTLKAKCRTHKQIADTLGISASYVNHIITATRKASVFSN